MTGHNHTSITAFLYALRDLHPDLSRQCLCGSCFRLYLLLREVWPEAEAWYDGDHVLTRIENRFYDIRGEVMPGKNHIRMSDDPIEFNRAYEWNRQKEKEGQLPKDKSRGFHRHTDNHESN